MKALSCRDSRNTHFSQTLLLGTTMGYARKQQDKQRLQKRNPYGMLKAIGQHRGQGKHEDKREKALVRFLNRNEE